MYIGVKLVKYFLTFSWQLNVSSRTLKKPYYEYNEKANIEEELHDNLNFNESKYLHYNISISFGETECLLPILKIS